METGAVESTWTRVRSEAYICFRTGKQRCHIKLVAGALFPHSIRAAAKAHCVHCGRTQLPVFDIGFQLINCTPAVANLEGLTYNPAGAGLAYNPAGTRLEETRGGVPLCFVALRLVFNIGASKYFRDDVRSWHLEPRVKPQRSQSYLRKVSEE